MASTPAARPSSHKIHTAEPIRAKPRKILRCTIQLPGCGRSLAQRGTKGSKTSGAAKPSALALNTAMMERLLPVRGSPKEAPEKEAEQGVAKMTTNTPSQQT